MTIVNAEILKDIDSKIYDVHMQLTIAKKMNRIINLDDCIHKLGIVLFHFGHDISLDKRDK